MRKEKDGKFKINIHTQEESIILATSETNYNQVFR
jgi:hypothetical protein